MQTAMTQRAFVAAQPVRAASKNTRAARSVVVVRASAEESRRAVLSGLLAGAVALTAGAANAGDLVDDRKAYQNDFERIYEARDADLPQAVRDGLSQARTDIEGTKKRIAESKQRIVDLEMVIGKNYWNEGRTELRRQVGTLRFDLNALAEVLPKGPRKEALAANKEFFKQVEALDLALLKKDEAKAMKALQGAKESLESTIAKLG